MKNEDVGEGLVPSRCPKRKTARLKDFDYAVGEGLVPSRYPSFLYNPMFIRQKASFC